MTEKTQKAFLIILALLMVFSVGAAALLAWQNYQLRQELIQQQSISAPSPQAGRPTPTTDPTANWQIYESEKWGYRLMYPSNWFVSEANRIVTRFSNQPIENSGKDIITVSVFKNTDVNVDSLASRKKRFENSPEEFRILKNIVVDGKPGFEVEFLKQGEREAVIAGDLSKIPPHIYTIFVTYQESQKEEALEIYQKILSTFITFKFLD